MKILYGVVGEGMGHAMRSRVILDHLVAQEHDVEIMASGRAVDYLAKRFEGVNKIHGLHMVYEENAYFDLLTSFQPQAVISDFESWTYLYAQTHRLPILSVDNMQIINRCKMPEQVVEGHAVEFQLTKAFIKSKLPWCDEYFITTFFHPEVRKKRTRLFPPILRPEILDAKRRNGEHLLVYTTGEGNDGFASALRETGLECRIYGMRRNLKSEEVDGNLRYQPFSEDKFIDDLASSRAVIAGGGFTLMGEAVYLHKPMLAVPLARQFEQVLNARYLQLEGYGRHAETLNDAKTILDFVSAIPACEAKLAAYSQDGNKLIFGAIDEWLDKAAAGIT